MKLQQRYKQDLEHQLIQADSQQAAIISLLQIKLDEIVAQDIQKQSWIFRFRKTIWLAKLKLVRGVYIWGGVGVGKTYLMDLFYEHIDVITKRRLHFHQFMQLVQQRLIALQGEANPLNIIAVELAKQAHIYCLDEFMVTEIGDAVILAKLLQEIFNLGVILVTTSNVRPADLYANGLQRGLFLPAIALIEKYTNVINLNGKVDYRLQNFNQAGVYFTPLTEAAAINMRQLYSKLTEGSIIKQEVISILDRKIKVISCNRDIIWFDFAVICNAPRSKYDYLEIAAQFHTIFISNVPVIKCNQDNIINYFINLVDVLYDAKVNVIVSAVATISELYTNGKYLFEFKRTKSRLLEMQTQRYWSQAHHNMQLR